jgi:hypothetical protein
MNAGWMPDSNGGYICKNDFVQKEKAGKYGYYNYTTDYEVMICIFTHATRLCRYHRVYAI